VFALAHATNRTGRFTLIERWRNNERLLAPNESPLKVDNDLTKIIFKIQNKKNFLKISDFDEMG
jgi:hypothetical protein